MKHQGRKAQITMIGISYVEYVNEPWNAIIQMNLNKKDYYNIDPNIYRIHGFGSTLYSD